LSRIPGCGRRPPQLNAYPLGRMVTDALVRSVSGSEYDLRGGSFVHSTAVLGTSLTAEWAAVRVRRAIEDCGATVSDDSTDTRISFKQSSARSAGIYGLVRVLEHPDGIEVTAGVDARLEFGMPIAVVLLLAALHYYSAVDDWVFGIFLAMVVAGSAVRYTRIARLLRFLTRAGTGIAESHAA
jgi:hypothetical protein